MKISRRDFLKGTAATTLFLSGFNLPILASSSRKKNLVVIMLRGGMDGLCAVPVIGDKNFEKRRRKCWFKTSSFRCKKAQFKRFF